MRPVLGLFVGLLILGCAGLAPKDHTVDAADRAVILEAQEVVDGLGLGVQVDPALESWVKRSEFDGTWEVEYSYEGDGLAVEHMVFIDPQDSGATWTGLTIGMSIADSGGDFQVVEVDGLLTWGDRQKCAHLETEGIRLGWMCIAQKGKTSMLLSVIGIGISADGPGSVDRLLGDHLRNLDSYAPKKDKVEP